MGKRERGEKEKRREGEEVEERDVPTSYSGGVVGWGGREV